MQHYWLNNGEADENGTYTAQVKDDDGPNGEPGKVLSTYKGKSVMEVANQLLASNANATAEIGRIRANRQPDRAAVQPAVAAPKPLTADDNFRLSVDLENGKAPEAIREIITRATGATPEQIGSVITQAERDRLDAYWKAEADAFLSSHPEYFPTPANFDKILKVLEFKKWDLTRNNLSIVYDELQAQGLLIERPAQQEETEAERPEPNRSVGPNPPVTTRPRAVSTGIRSSDASAQPPTPSGPRPKYTARQLQEMPRSQYHELMRDPAFRKTIDSSPRAR